MPGANGHCNGRGATFEVFLSLGTEDDGGEAGKLQVLLSPISAEYVMANKALVTFLVCDKTPRSKPTVKQGLISLTVLDGELISVGET